MKKVNVNTKKNTKYRLTLVDFRIPSPVSLSSGLENQESGEQNNGRKCK